MPRSRSAKIALPSRVEIDTEIANLTESSVFIKTVEPLRFADRVQLTLFNVPVRATVAFVSGEIPRGVVLVFTAPPPLLDQIAMNAMDIEVVAPSVDTLKDSWSDALDPSTEPGLTAIVEHNETDPTGMHLDILPPEIDMLAPEELKRIEPTDDIIITKPEPIEIPPPPPPVQPAAPVPQANARSVSTARASSAAPAPPANMDTLGAMLDEVRRSLGTPVPAPPVPPASAQPAPVQPQASISTSSLPAAKPRAMSGAGLPAPSAAPRPAPPRSISTAATLPPPQPRAASTRAAPVNDGVVPDLPLLEGDGVTLRFASPDQYRTQHKANIAHGGIIVRSTPLPIGTQKFLGLEIPGKDRYTISARVTFIGDGTVGFVIDSFPIHKAQLKAFADV